MARTSMDPRSEGGAIFSSPAATAGRRPDGDGHLSPRTAAPTSGAGPAAPTYAVGYGKPPLHSRFQKGVSGNRRGRPRTIGSQKISDMILAQSQRKVLIKEGDTQQSVTMLEAILRGIGVSAAKGNGPAQRQFLDLVNKAIEHLEAVEAKQAAAKTGTEQYDPVDTARKLAFIIAEAKAATEAGN